jgi:hypothetical protein
MEATWAGVLPVLGFWQAQAPEPVWRGLLTPAILIPALALLIPVLAVLLSGLKGVVRAMRGEPDDFEQWQAELDSLRARVEELERARSAQPSSYEGQV